MMRKFFSLLAIVILSFCFAFPFADSAYGAFWDRTKTETETVTVTAEKKDVPLEKSEQSVAVPQKSPEIGELTREEIIANLKEVFQYHQNITAGINGLNKVEDGQGGTSYEFNGQKLEDLDNSVLSSLFQNANQQLSLENFDRTQKQLRELKQLQSFNKMRQTERSLKNLRQIDNLNRTQRALRQTARSVNPPKTYTPPKTYRAQKRY
ncbi:MAG: hypothetical protein ABH844_05075 [Candidatus Omnitrophota bacterium]